MSVPRPAWQCIHRRIDLPPPADGDVGGLPHPIFSRNFVHWVQSKLPASATVLEPAVWGCGGGCYYRVASFLHAAHRPAANLSVASRLLRKASEQLSMSAVGMNDVIGPAIAMLLGLRVRPWTAVSEGRTRIASLSMVNVPAEDRILEHKCPKQLELRRACGRKAKWSER